MGTVCACRLGRQCRDRSSGRDDHGDRVDEPVRCASAGSRSRLVSAQRYSIATFSPSTKPASFRPLVEMRAADPHQCYAATARTCNDHPFTGMVACCARAMLRNAGRVATPPQKRNELRVRPLWLRPARQLDGTVVLDDNEVGGPTSAVGFRYSQLRLWNVPDGHSGLMLPARIHLGPLLNLFGDQLAAIGGRARQWPCHPCRRSVP